MTTKSKKSMEEARIKAIKADKEPFFGAFAAIEREVFSFARLSGFLLVFFWFSFGFLLVFLSLKP